MKACPECLSCADPWNDSKRVYSLDTDQLLSTYLFGS